MSPKEMLLKELMAYDFAIIELNLYLDTHPNDRRALDLHNSYVVTSKGLRDKYEVLYGPLTAVLCESKYPWQWVINPWPWEKTFMD